MTNPIELQYQVEQFYFHEAELLDNRQYLEWLKLLDPDIQYVLPSRINAQVENRLRGSQSMIAVDAELEDKDSEGCPLREENIAHLTVRADRAYKVNSWAEHPPPRTRRLISNVRIKADNQGLLTCRNNFLLHYCRPGSRNFVYSGERQDCLSFNSDTINIRRRRIILDYADVNYPTVGLFF